MTTDSEPNSCDGPSQASCRRAGHYATTPMCPGLLCTIGALLFGCLVASCGYYFRADGVPMGLKFETLAIPLIESTSSELGFEADFTKIIREEFISHGDVRLVSREKAEAILTGRIHEIRWEALTFDLQEQTVQGRSFIFGVTNSRQLRIRLDIRLIERESRKTIWHDDSMEEVAAFVVDPDPLITRFSERRALEEIARLLAKRIFLKTMERF